MKLLAFLEYPTSPFVISELMLFQVDEDVAASNANHSPDVQSQDLPTLN